MNKPRPLLLLACSARKEDHPCRADEFYQGTVFRLGVQWAKKHNHRVLILSALHGWVKPSAILEPYDTKRIASYRGPWPRGKGYYLGGKLYFEHVPVSFLPLVPCCRMGYMASNMTYLLEGHTRTELFSHPTRSVLR